MQLGEIGLTRVVPQGIERSVHGALVACRKVRNVATRPRERYLAPNASAPAEQLGSDRLPGLGLAARGLLAGLVYGGRFFRSEPLVVVRRIQKRSGGA